LTILVSRLESRSSEMTAKFGTRAAAVLRDRDIEA
jgi:hypothetical protein